MDAFNLHALFPAETIHALQGGNHFLSSYAVFTRHRWKYNIKKDLQEEACGDMDWIDLAQDRDRWRALVIAVMNLQVPSNVVNFLTS